MAPHSEAGKGKRGRTAAEENRGVVDRPYSRLCARVAVVVAVVAMTRAFALPSNQPESFGPRDGFAASSTSLEFRIPVVAPQMNASSPAAVSFEPTITDQSAVAALALALSAPPARSPSDMISLECYLTAN